ncbi:type VI secretion system contractile sheath small subunit [candidate division KSB1 bacterium]|jgi:type VI secretion system protein ImpB|nr:type VI secretion system contractile sheath small subunit [candidate division KSB1 bacterium]
MNDKPTIKSRVTVSILPSTTAKEEVELDYRVLVTGDYSKSKLGKHKDGKRLKDRKLRVISNKEGFGQVMRDLNPQLNIFVPDKISGEADKQLKMEMGFKSMKDFHPDQLTENVPALKKLLSAREALNNLKLAVVDDPDKIDVLNDLLTSDQYSQLVDGLLSKLGPATDTDSSAPQKKEE